MRKIIAPALSVCILCLAACHKDNVNSPAKPNDSTTTSTPLGSMKINLLSSESFWSDTATGNVELIISEPGGTVLLDTITPANIVVTASLQVSTSTVDLTNIYFEPYSKRYMATTYKGVNPSGWSGDFSLPYIAPKGIYPTIFWETLNLINTPTTHFFNFQGELTSSTIFLGANTINLDYSTIPGNYAYAFFQDLGLYKMVNPTQNPETIDCSTLDTTVTTNLTLPSYFTWSNTSLIGYTDSTRLTSQLPLYSSWPAVNWPELMYPTKYIQKYALQTNATHGNETVQSYSYSNVVNTNISYPDPGSYSIGASQSNLFTVAWNAAKPSYYNTTWSDSTVVWTLYASPDSTTVNPLGLFTAQKAKMLQNQDLTKLALNAFQFETVDAYNYTDYLGLVCDSTQIRRHLVTNGSMYSKSF